MRTRNLPDDDIDERPEEDDGEEEEEKEYDEHADEDFNPEEADADEDHLSSSDEEPPAAESARKSKKRKAEPAHDADLDSGDEATIQERERKHKKRRQNAGADADEDSGGEGGFIRTRAQRVVEKEERKNRKRARDGAVTIDVDQVWADLLSVPVGRVSLSDPKPHVDALDADAGHDKENAAGSAEDEEMVTVRRRIEYAGQIEEVEAHVPRRSREAQDWLAAHPEAADARHHRQQANDSSAGGLKRPLRRPSLFEPNPLGAVKGVAPEKLRRRAPTRMDVLMAMQRAAEAEEKKKAKAQKLSTVQKSAMDWRGFVDREEGLREELDEYGKSRANFLAREAHLDRAHGARQQRAQEARWRL